MQTVAERYIGQRATTGEFFFQEWTRRCTAEYSTKDWFTLVLVARSLHIDFPSTNDHLETDVANCIKDSSVDVHSLSNAYFDFCEAQLAAARPLWQSTSSVDHLVKRIWTWPLHDPEPFHILPITFEHLSLCAGDEFEFECRQGAPLCLKRSKGGDIVDAIWEQRSLWWNTLMANNEGYGFELVRPPLRKDCMSVLDTDVAQRHRTILKDLIEKYNARPRDLRLSTVLHTFEESAAAYETRLAVKLFSYAIESFLAEFNQLTGLQTSSRCQQITFAVRFRE